MTPICRFLVAALVLVVPSGVVAARAVRVWSYHELLQKSDFVVIAAPTASRDNKERIDLPGFPGEHVVGVDTAFTISAVLKGDKGLRALVLHHYRTADGTNIPHVPNGPGFVSFAPARTYILFLLREADGRYAPVVGQADPGLAAKELRAVSR